MKLLSISGKSGCRLATLAGAFSLAPLHAQVTADGIRDVAESYTELAVQQQTSDFGASNTLANLHYVRTGKLLNLFAGGRVNGNAIILFIDSKPGGISEITGNTIKAGDFPGDINRLAPDSGTGMTFENGFLPDSAIRIYGTNNEAYISRYNLVSGVMTNLGRADETAVSNGPVTAAKALWSDVTGSYASVTNGVEISLNMALLGVPEGAQTVKVMAILVNGDSTYGSNQALGSLSSPATVGGNIRGFNFETEPLVQTLDIAVNRPALVGSDDEDGDGLINSNDPFPLDQARDISFSVNMNVERLKHHFEPPSTVQVQFFSGEQPALSTLNLADPDQDGIYTGTLADAKGFAGSPFGTYKFITNDPLNDNGGYETGFDRSFILPAPGTPFTLATAFFSGITNLDYATWAAANAAAGAPGGDADLDGVKNAVEFFMGEKSGTFTTNPQPIAGKVIWKHSPLAAGLNYRVLTSTNLATWTDVTADPGTTDANGQLSYTLPTGLPKTFVRLEVTVP